MIASSTIRNPRPKAAKAAIVIGILAWLAPFITFVGGIFIYPSSGNFAGDGGPNLIGLVYLAFGLLATGVLAFIGALICLFGCGASPYPEDRRPWLLPKLLNYPLGLLSFVAGLYWLARRFHL